MRRPRRGAPGAGLGAQGRCCWMVGSPPGFAKTPEDACHPESVAEFELSTQPRTTARHGQTGSPPRRCTLGLCTWSSAPQRRRPSQVVAGSNLAGDANFGTCRKPRCVVERGGSVGSGLRATFDPPNPGGCRSGGSRRTRLRVVRDGPSAFNEIPTCLETHVSSTPRSHQSWLAHRAGCGRPAIVPRPTNPASPTGRGRA